MFEILTINLKTMKNLKHFEALNFNQLLIELNNLASSAEQEAIFANHPQLRPDYDAGQNSILNKEMRIEIYSKIALRKSAEECLKIRNEAMAVLIVLGQKENEDLPQATMSIIKDLTNRIQDSVQKVFDLYMHSK